MRIIYIILLIIILLIVNYNIKIFNFINKIISEYYMNTKINNEYFNIIPFYFIHIPKNMGMNIISSLPYNYTNQYFGIGYTKKNKIILSRSHLILNDVYTHYPECIYIPKIAIIRNPVDRFLSMCNFHRISPNFFIKVCNYNKKNKQTLPTIYNLFNFTKRQYEFIKTNKNDNIILLDFKDRDKIYNTFKKFNVLINVYKKKNESQIIYSKKHLTDYHLKFINEYYKKDFILYNKVKKK